MNARYQYSTLKSGFVLIAVLACALSGCWEEVHYSPPQAETAPAASTSAKTEGAIPEDQATGFADDVADSLAKPSDSEPLSETASAVGEPAIDESGVEESPTTLQATPPTATVPPTDPARGPRRMAWLLGSDLSLAALANDRAAPEDKIADWFDKSQRLAKLLGTTVAELPPRPAAADVDPQATRAIDYLFTQGQSIGRQLGIQYGDDHVALFELALKSNILLVRYQPGAPVVKALSAAISQSGERARLPADLYQPLLTLLDEGATVTAVRDAVFQMHFDVDRFLSSAQQ